MIASRTRARRWALGLALAAAGCQATPRLPECDAYLDNLERLARCPAVPEDVRGTLATSALSIRRALAAAADADDDGTIRGQIRSTCRAGNQHLEATLALRVPACFDDERGSAAAPPPPPPPPPPSTR